MEQSRNIERSEVWQQIYKEVKTLPIDCEVGWDAPDIPSVTTSIEQLFLKLLPIHGVINWVALKSNIKPEDDTEVLVRLNSGKVRTALFSGVDNRFYNSLNEQDITEIVIDYASMPK